MKKKQKEITARDLDKKFFEIVQKIQPAFQKICEMQFGKLVIDDGLSDQVFFTACFDIMAKTYPEYFGKLKPPQTMIISLVLWETVFNDWIFERKRGAELLPSQNLKPDPPIIH